jgi:hypothetical protein
MFIQAKTIYGKRVIINTDAIAYIDLDVEIYPEDEPPEAGIRIWLNVAVEAKTGCGSICLKNLEFMGQQAEKLTQMLSHMFNVQVI